MDGCLTGLHRMRAQSRGIYFEHKWSALDEPRYRKNDDEYNAWNNGLDGREGDHLSEIN